VPALWGNPPAVAGARSRAETEDPVVLNPDDNVVYEFHTEV